MINKKIDEAIFDVLLENAFADAIEEDVKKLQDEEEPCTISTETDLKIRRLIAQVGKREKPNTMRLVFRVASIVLVVLLNISLIGILMIPSVNAEVKNVFSQLFEKYESYENKEQESYVVSTSEYILSYIPDGLELMTYDDYQILYREKEPGKGYVMINISDEDFARISFDSENSSSEPIKINGMDAELCAFNDEYYIVWYDGSHFISLYSNMDKAELIKTAKNIKKIQ